MNINNLKECFNTAIELNKKYVAIKVKMQGFEKEEIIVNERENFKDKLDYYIKAYNEDLTLKTFNGIRITAFTYADTFKDIEEDLL